MAKTAYQCPECWQVHRNGSGECPDCGCGPQLTLCQRHFSGYSPHCRRCRALAADVTEAAIGDTEAVSESVSEAARFPR